MRLPPVMPPPLPSARGSCWCGGRGDGGSAGAAPPPPAAGLLWALLPPPARCTGTVLASLWPLLSLLAGKAPLGSCAGFSWPAFCASGAKACAGGAAAVGRGDDVSRVGERLLLEGVGCRTRGGVAMLPG